MSIIVEIDNFIAFGTKYVKLYGTFIYLCDKTLYFILGDCCYFLGYKITIIVTIVMVLLEFLCEEIDTLIPASFQILINKITCT